MIGKIVTAVTTPPALAHVFVTRMLTRDLFTVANFHTCACFTEHEVCVK